MTQASTATGFLEPDTPESIYLVAEALTAYITDLQSATDICLRHQTHTAVHSSAAALTTIQRLASPRKIEKRVRDIVETLLPWEESPWWKTEKYRWESLLHRALSQPQGNPLVRTLLRRGVLWKGYPVLLWADEADDGAATITVLLPHLPSDLPELPLFTLARALAYHEQLVPAALMQPLPFCANLAPAWATVRDFLKRAMPENLAASQCFFLQSEEPSPDPPASQAGNATPAIPPIAPVCPRDAST